MLTVADLKKKLKGLPGTAKVCIKLRDVPRLLLATIAKDSAGEFIDGAFIVASLIPPPENIIEDGSDNEN